jgi:hypothetical protein
MNKLPSFVDLYRAIIGVKSEIPPAQAATSYAPSTQLALALTTSLAAPDSTNIRVVGQYSATGKVLLTARFYIETDTDMEVLTRCVGVSGGTTTDTVCAGRLEAGAKQVVDVSWIVSGTAFGAGTWYLQLSKRTASGVVTFACGGLSSTIRPPAFLSVTPIA